IDPTDMDTDEQIANLQAKAPAPTATPAPDVEQPTGSQDDPRGAGRETAPASATGQETGVNPSDPAPTAPTTATLNSGCATDFALMSNREWRKYQTEWVETRLRNARGANDLTGVEDYERLQRYWQEAVRLHSWPA